MLFTEQLLEDGRSINGAWSLKQLKALGIVHQRSRKFPYKGWKKRLINSDIPRSKVELFLSLKDVHLKKKVLTEETDLDSISHMDSITNEIKQAKQLF